MPTPCVMYLYYPSTDRGLLKTQNWLKNNPPLYNTGVNNTENIQLPLCWKKVFIFDSTLNGSKRCVCRAEATIQKRLLFPFLHYDERSVLWLCYLLATLVFSHQWSVILECVQPSCWGNSAGNVENSLRLVVACEHVHSPHGNGKTGIFGAKC